MPAMSSGIVPMTKQLNRVTARSVPAPAMIRPAGRNRKSASASMKRFSQADRPLGSAAAIARATRCQLSSMVLSTGAPPAFFSRYFMSQI